MPPCAWSCARPGTATRRSERSPTSGRRRATHPRRPDRGSSADAASARPCEHRMMTDAPEILRYAAFTDRPNGGNPAGVVLDAAGLDDEAMQRIAAEVDFSETAFVT